MQGPIRIASGLVRWVRSVFELVFGHRAVVISDWGRVIVDPQPLLGNRRQQVADVASGGSRRFAVAYIASTATAAMAPAGDRPALPAPHDEPPPEPLEEMGDLRFAHFEVDTGLKTPPQTVAGLQAGWVRATTGGPVTRRDCPLVVQFLGAGFQLPWRLNPEFITFFAYGGAVDGGLREAGLLRVRWCNARVDVTRIPVNVGMRPAVAIGRRAGETKLLFVYGFENQIFGSFRNLAGEPIGPGFVLATFPDAQAVRSTDVIWNAVADRFIVGYMQHESGHDTVDPSTCSVRNVRVTWDGVPDEPRIHGACDPERGGHHTSVAHDDRPDANPDGVYAWWYQGIDDGKGIRMMDASGEPTGNRVELAQSAWTQPVAARRETPPPWPFGPIFGQPPGSYTVAARKSPGSGSEQRMSGWTFETDSDLHPLGLLGTTSQGADPVAIGALVNESVSVWRAAGQDGTGPSWGLTVFSHTTQPQVALETQR